MIVNMEEKNQSICSNINWNEVWKEKMKANNKMPGGQNCVSYFEDINVAKSYSRWVQNQSSYKFKDELLNEISKIEGLEKLRVLDIGAGPGRHTLPLSKIVKEVTAVEPSKAMLCCLKENLEKYEIKNVSSINKMWENIELGQDILEPYEIIISSFSLSYYDIRSALKKMNDASSGYVFIVYDTKSPVWEEIYMTVWSSLYGSEYVPKPKVDCLVNVLWQMDIYPNILSYHKNDPIEFKGIEEFFKNYMINLNLTTNEQKQAINEYFNKNLVKKDGKKYFNMNTDYSIVWWKIK